MNYLNGMILDGSVIRIELDKGFREHRRFGRGAQGGQVRMHASHSHVLMWSPSIIAAVGFSRKMRSASILIVAAPWQSLNWRVTVLQLGMLRMVVMILASISRRTRPVVPVKMIGAGMVTGDRAVAAVATGVGVVEDEIVVGSDVMIVTVIVIVDLIEMVAGIVGTATVGVHAPDPAARLVDDTAVAAVVEHISFV